jgi:hypothetical protein
MDKLKLAYDFVQACYTQSCYEDQVSKAFQLINPDNTVFGLADPIRQHYEELVAEILGEAVMDWIYYWQYECDYGQASMDFQIDGVEYNTQDITLYKFLGVTCGLTK